MPMLSFANRVSSCKKYGVALLVVSALTLAAGGPAGVPVLQAQGRSDLENAHRRMLPLFELAGVVYTDADEANGRLVVGVIDRGVEGLVRGRLKALGMAAQSVDVVETEPIAQLATLRDQIRPVVAGYQIRFSNYVCSIGFNAIRNGVIGFVSASHCSTRQGRVDGTKYYQPLNQVPGELIGTEVVDPAYQRFAGCPVGRVCRYSDSNFIEGAGGATFEIGAIAKTTGANNGSLTIDGKFVVASEGTGVNGNTVEKVGRTTGWTRGTQTNTCANTGVSGTNIVLICQNFVQSTGTIVGGGDSGAPVFKTISADAVSLVGNLWGGNTSGTMFVYSPLSGIERELGNLSVIH